MELAYIQEMSSRLGLKLDPERIPRHVAIVMDGNGRWAKQHGLERSAGHRRGVEALENIVIGCRNLGIRYLTVYAFSTENWSRPKAEVGTLMELLSEFTVSKLARLRDNQVQVKVIGDFAGLPMLQRVALKRLLDATAEQEGLTLNLALNYGGRTEIIQAVKRAAAELSPSQMRSLTEEEFAGFLYTTGQPDPDLLIRTSGELRLSNFLLWQLAYAEFYFADTLWPDFDEEELFRAVVTYQQRQRRFGGVEPAW